jgi:hypothetical protein
MRGNPDPPRPREATGVSKRLLYEAHEFFTFTLGELVRETFLHLEVDQKWGLRRLTLRRKSGAIACVLSQRTQHVLPEFPEDAQRHDLGDHGDHDPHPE